MIRIDYKDTDKKVEVEIYGLKFEINKNEIENIDTKNIEENSLEEIIKKVLGEDAINQINNKRKQDGYEEMDTQVKLTIVMFLVETYVNASINPINNMIDKANNTYNNMNRNINKVRRNNKNRYRRY